MIRLGVILVYMLLVTGCAIKNYNKGDESTLALLHPISNEKSFIGTDVKNILIYQINGESAGSAIGGVGGDEKVVSGKTNILVKYWTRALVTATTTLIFDTIAGKNYNIQCMEIDDKVKFTVSVDEKVILEKYEKKEVLKPSNPVYIPIFL